MAIVALAGFGAGCSKLVGFGDVTARDAKPGDDATTAIDGPPVDVPVDVPGVDAQIDAMQDAMIDGPPPKLWVFVTDAGFAGGFGVPAGSRVTADIKCQDMYNATFTARACTNIHAVIQIDDTVDSLARMDITFPIPQTSEVLRATDETPVTQNWDTLVNPNASLLAPVSGEAAAVPFWSGRGVASNLQCSNWTSSSATVQGNAGDATKVNAWMTQSNFNCNNFNQHLLCICW